MMVLSALQKQDVALVISCDNLDVPRASARFFIDSPCRNLYVSWRRDIRFLGVMSQRYSRKPIAMTAELEGFSLRAHLALSYLQTSPPDFPRVLELACYVESARLGASRHFQSPPKALVPARALLTDWLQALESSAGTGAGSSSLAGTVAGRIVRRQCLVAFADACAGGGDGQRAPAIGGGITPSARPKSVARICNKSSLKDIFA
ncbi:hypothetical protein [Chromobacterium sp. ATCC 53434]|uniref:hypothetical protein n=1 Tax=Chromobacterium sp. (strain ATCC 53434 / SC 14030) TaxID=2059672 RepID=UPI0013051D0D|nr:hypothetical protein [Chromobacterium sp. ATCC 53434]